VRDPQARSRRCSLPRRIDHFSRLPGPHHGAPAVRNGARFRSITWGENHQARLRNLGRDWRVSVPDWTAFVLKTLPHSAEISWRHTMSFPWPVTDDELILNDALDIAMRHFDLPSDEEEYAAVESFVGKAIMDDWRRGVRNKVVLANKAIAEVEDHRLLGNKLPSAS
jgi:hypothetical protein